MAIRRAGTPERGSSRPGSRPAPPTWVIATQPSYAHSTATSATPNDAIWRPSGASDQSGVRFAALPPGSTNPTTINTATSPTFIRVTTFSVIAPRPPPGQLTPLTPTYDRPP